jgi:hypothetical protein
MCFSFVCASLLYFLLAERQGVTAMSIPTSIFFSFHPIADMLGAVLTLHAIRVATHEKAKYVAID